MPKTLFENPFRQDLNLNRFPETKDEALQAWDSADELLLQYLKKEELTGRRILILNDAFGALACALEPFAPTVYSDSYLSSRAIELNSHGKIKSISTLVELSGIYDRVIFKIPKNLSFFEDELIAITNHLNAESFIVAGGKLKYLPKTCFDLLEKIIGKTTTSLASKKSRLIFCRFEKEKKTSPYPMKIKLDGFAKPFTHHSNLFSREKLDVGTRFFLAHFPEGNFKRVLDLGCGNGVLGIAAKLKYPEAEIYFSDESAMALLSAKENYSAYFSKDAHYFWTHSFPEQKSLDLVLCNPPFHRENSLESDTAEQMFRDANRSLIKGGLLRVVANSHLPYGPVLKALFGNSRRVATHAKFLVWESLKTQN